MAGAATRPIAGPARVGPAIARLAQLPVLRRLVRALFVGFTVMVIAFGLIRFIPGDPALLALGDLATEETLRETRRRMGLEGSIAEQFARYLGGVVRGDLGNSMTSGDAVTNFVLLSLPVTIWLIAVSFTTALLIAIPLGVLAALYRRIWFGNAFRVATSIFLSTPTFFSGLLAILLFAILLGVAPVAGYEYSFPANLGYLWLPALVNCGILVPILSRVMQASIVDTLGQEFVETAVVRGLPYRVFVWRYLIRPSIAPTVSLVGYMMGQGLAASVITEIIFNLPGIGTTLIEAVLRRDYTMMQGITLVFGVIVVFVSFVSDLLSGWLDPRTRTS